MIDGRGMQTVYEMDRSNDEVEFRGMNVGYIRVSHRGDVTQDVEAQKIAIQRFVEDRGGVVVYWYVDDGITGEALAGPALQRMLADAESGSRGFPRVFVWSKNRLTRDSADFETLKRRLSNAGVELVSVREGVLTN